MVYTRWSKRSVRPSGSLSIRARRRRPYKIAATRHGEKEFWTLMLLKVHRGGEARDLRWRTGPHHGRKAKDRPRVGAVADGRGASPGRVTALEESLKTYAETRTGLVVEPVIGTRFDSLAEAYEFNLFSWEVGFGIRYGKSRSNC
ncbi:hypothetical protein BRADI_1g40350v3 [Brachypodium distachyon]|uniref:Uncharacterized protein n=1 Tax=Brachypodium distachyon TaxID=15368 RepID=A0A0Q3NLF9_BRADI|nr:hypothetical protein BRADI_1g40350v3 [Brachypodium distachyon]